jgi:hypothetical protein
MKWPARFFLIVLAVSTWQSAYSQVQFTETVHVDDDSAFATNQWQSHAALGPGGLVCVVWSDESGGDGDILFSQKSPADSVFSLPIRVNDGPAGTAQAEPSMAVNAEGDVFVVWTDSRSGNRDIFFARKLSGEELFAPSFRVVFDTSGADQFDPVIAAKGDSIFIAWEDLRMLEPDIYSIASTDGGDSFTPNIMVNEFLPGVEQHAPDAAIDSEGTIHAVWEDMRSGWLEVYIAKNETWGGAFSAGTPVYDTEAIEQRAPSIAVGPMDCLGVVWWDVNFLTKGVVFSKSCAGSDFTDPVTVYSSMEGSSYFTDIAITSDAKIHVCHNADGMLMWDQCYEIGAPLDRLFYATSSDSGVTFESFDVTEIADDDQALVVRSPSVLAQSPGKAFVVWTDTRHGNPFSEWPSGLSPFAFDVFANTVDPDSGVGEVQRVNRDPNPFEHTDVGVAAGPGGSVTVCWSENRTGVPLLHCTASEDSGKTFGPSVPVAEPMNGRYQRFPEIEMFPTGEVGIAWCEQEDYWIEGIFFAKSNDIYSGFSDPVPVSDGSDLSIIRPFEMEIDVLGHVSVVWSDRRSGDYNIYFSRSSDGGATFGANIMVNTETIGNQSDPYIALDEAGDAYVVWADTRDGSNDVYFARTRGGEDFGEEVKVGGPMLNPVVGVDAHGDIHVMWWSNSIYICTSTDGGDTFSDERIALSIPSEGVPQYIILEVRGDTLCLLTESWVSDGDWCSWHEVLFSVSTDGGETFADFVVVSEDSMRYAQGPDLAVDRAGNVITAWTDPRRAPYSVFYYWAGEYSLDALKHVFLRRGTVQVGIEEPNEDIPLPKAYGLAQNYPNPFNPSTTIPFDIPAEAGPGVRVGLRIYSLRGELVRTLVDEVKEPGAHRVAWDGKDGKGLTVGSGVYFARIEAGEFSSVRKMLLLK